MSSSEDSLSNDKSQHLKRIEHILPSFEMHNHLFNRSVLDNEYVTGTVNPPTYEDNLNSTAVVNPVDENGYVDPTLNPDMIVLNNLNSLPTLLDVPIKVSVALTKGIHLEKKNPYLELESRFREYKPGDFVTGYVLIENTSDKSIPFEMFLVSLEGTVTSKYNINNYTDRRKVFRKNFLKMYDLCACYHIGSIDVGPSADRCGQVCPQTGAEYGLKDTKMLKPHSKFKKLFIFKLPEYLLDTSCEHQSPEHLKIPPSFGVDTECLGGKGATIKVDDSLGYGIRKDEPGSPIRVKDLSDYRQSVSYFINIKMIGRNLDTYRQFINTDNITKYDYDFIILQDIQHYFRVTTVNSKLLGASFESDWHFKSHLTTDEQVRQLQDFLNDQIEELKLRNSLIKAGITDTPLSNDIISDRPYRKKKATLYAENIEKTKVIGVVENVVSATINKSLFNKTEGELLIEISTSDLNSINAIYPVTLKKVIQNTLLVPQYSILNRHLEGSSISGTTTSTRSNSIFDDSTRKAQSISTISNSSNCKVPLTPVTSTLRKASDTINISLTFNPKNASKPPESIKILPKLRAMNLQSETSIPFNIDGEFLMESSSIQSTYQKILNLKKDMLRDLMKLEEITKPNDLKVPKLLYENLKSMSKINLTNSTRSIFKKIERTNLNWKQDNKGIYYTSLEIDLIIDEEIVGKAEYCIIPSFQTCLLSRLYSVQLEFTSSKGRFKEGIVLATLPINVV